MSDLHPKNKGIAKSFGDLLSKMKQSTVSSSSQSTYSSGYGYSSYYSSSYGSSYGSSSGRSASYETPTDFKYSFSRACGKFDGYSQEDAQEFLVSLLELLNTDLNRQKNPAKYKELEFNPKKSLEANVDHSFSSDLNEEFRATGKRLV